MTYPFYPISYDLAQRVRKQFPIFNIKEDRTIGFDDTSWKAVLCGREKGTCRVADENTIRIPAASTIDIFLDKDPKEPLGRMEIASIYVAPFGEFDPRMTQLNGYDTFEEWRDVMRTYKPGINSNWIVSMYLFGERDRL
jgi:uncharacterized protein YhfF